MKKLLLAIALFPALLFGQYNQQNINVSKIGGVAPSKVNTTDTATALPFRQVPQREFRSTFAAVRSSFNTAYWNNIKTGSGMTATQSAGNGLITTGTTANSETIIRSTEAFRGAMTLKAKVTLSQRIANQQFFVELVDVIGDNLSITISSATVAVVTFPSGHGFTSENVGQSMYLGAYTGTGTFVPGRYAIASVSGDNVTFTVAGFAAGSGTCSAFGWNYHQITYSGTTATNSLYDAQREGWNSGTTTATISTTASPGHVDILNIENGSSLYADQLVASAVVKAITERASRVENMPGSSVPLYLQIRAVNGSSAPASTTTFTLGFASVEDYVPVQTSLVSTRPQSPHNGTYVSILGTPATTVSSGTITTVSTLTGGGVAEDAATSASPVPVGGVARTGLPATTVIAGDAVRATFSTSGQLITKPFAPGDLDFNSNVTVTTNTQTAIRAAQGASIRQNVTGITYQNTSATATTLTIQDGSTTLVTFSVPASMTIPAQLTFWTPLKGTANTALNYTAGTTGANILLNVTGYNSY